MLAMTHEFMNAGLWQEQRGVNLLDSGAHFYEVYETKDHKYMAVGAIEEKFYFSLLKGLGLGGSNLPPQMDRTMWPAMKERFTNIFLEKTREDWTEIFSEIDACVTPVLSPSEAAVHPYNTAREVFLTGPATQPSPVPRFSETPSSIRTLSSSDDEVNEGLLSWGIDGVRQQSLRDSGALV
jgi:alpha-methylacyl-CoA racemase